MPIIDSCDWCYEETEVIAVKDHDDDICLCDECLKELDSKIDYKD